MANAELSILDLCTIAGWANFTKHSASNEEETWDEHDERVFHRISDLIVGEDPLGILTAKGEQHGSAD